MDVSNEDLLVALVLVLAKQIAHEEKNASPSVIGGNPERDVVQLIRNKKAEVLRLLLQG